MILALLLGLLSLAGATDFYITQPWAETKWKAGDTVHITWKVYQDVGPQATSVILDLMDGDDNAANFLLNIATNLSPEANSFEWAIPKTISSSNGVFIRITGQGEVPNYRFSHRFVISDGEAPGVTMSAVPPAFGWVDVSSLVRALPTGKPNTVIPPAVSLIDPDAVETVVTSTITATEPTGFKNRDRLSQSAASTLLLPSILLFVMAVLALA